MDSNSINHTDVDAVGNIHKRFYLTLINPSSYKTSLAIALACVSAIAYLSSASIEIMLIALPIAYMLFRLDYLLLKRYPVAKDEQGLPYKCICYTTMVRYTHTKYTTILSIINR